MSPPTHDNVVRPVIADVDNKDSSSFDVYNNYLEDDDMDDEFMHHKNNSFEEQCGFVLHVLIVMLSFYYTSYILSFYSSPILISVLQSDDSSIINTSTPLLLLSQKSPSPVWTIVLPITLIVLFFLVPIVYGCCINRSAVVINNQHRKLSILQDPQAIRPIFISPLRFMYEHHNNQSAVSLYDSTSSLWNSYEITYYRNPMAWKPTTVPLTTDCSKSTTPDNNTSTMVTTSTSIPDICDIDVADINDLLYMKYK